MGDTSTGRSRVRRRHKKLGRSRGEGRPPPFPLGLFSAVSARRRGRGGVHEKPPPAALVLNLLEAALLVGITLLAMVAAGWRKTWTVYAVETAIWLLVVIWAVRLLQGARLSLVISPLGPPVALFGLYAAVRYLKLSAETNFAGRGDFWMVISCIALFFVTMNMMRHRWQLQLVLWALLFVGVIMASTSLVDYANGQGFWGWLKLSDSKVIQSLSLSFAPEHVAAAMLLIVPLLLAAVCLTRLLPAVKIIFASAALLMLEAVVFSGSRAAWLALGFCLLLLLVLFVRQRLLRLRWAVVALALLVALAFANIVFSPALQARVPKMLGPIPAALLSLWDGALRMGAMHPIIGVGGGMFPYWYPAFRADAGSGLPSAASSDWLQLFAEYGLIGVALMLWMLVVLTITALRLTSRWKLKPGFWFEPGAEGRGTRHGLMVGVMAAMGAIALHSLWASVFHVPGLALLVVMAVAVAMAGGRPWGRRHTHLQGQESTEGEEPDLVRSVHLKTAYARVLGIVLLAISIGFGFWIGRSLVASIHVELGDSLRNLGQIDAAREHYKKGWDWDTADAMAAARLGNLSLKTIASKDEAELDAEKTVAEAKEAVRWYQLAIDRMPRNAQYWVGLAKAQSLLNDCEGTRYSYNKALELEPRNADYHIEFALVHLRWKERDGAIELLNKAVSIGDPKGIAKGHLEKLVKPAPTKSVPR